MRYIDADALLSKLPDDLPYKASVKRVLMQAPTTDAVEVVRCRDCKYFTIDEGDCLGLCRCGNIATNYGGEIYPKENHFCSYGERNEK